MSLPRTLTTRHGELTLRDELPGDAPFLSRIFTEDVAATLGLADIPEAMRADLIAMQYRAREAGHRATFPTARRLIVESGGTQVARLVLGEGPHIVDIAVDRAFRRRGIAAALLGAIMLDRPVSAEVLVTNLASLALFRGMGFGEQGQNGAAHVQFRWVPK